jgi:hypothetical protein
LLFTAIPQELGKRWNVLLTLPHGRVEKQNNTVPAVSRMCHLVISLYYATLWTLAFTGLLGAFLRKTRKLNLLLLLGATAHA